MKIRSGFVSNSSSSSFVLAYLPQDFDFDTHMEYLKDKYKDPKKKYEWDEIKRISESDIDNFKRTGRFSEQRDETKFWMLKQFLEDFTLFRGETAEGCGEIRLMNQALFDKMKLIDAKTQKNYVDFGEKSRERKKKKEEMKIAMKHIDPFDEENWEVPE